MIKAGSYILKTRIICPDFFEKQKGTTPLQTFINFVYKLLSLARRSDIPVFAGCRAPVLGGRSFNWFGHEAGETLEPGEEPEISDEHGVDALLRLSREHEALEIVAVGPLTNIAVALMKDPDLAGRVERLTVMGGHIRRVEYGGHVYALGVDYNLCSDPHASYLTLRSGIPTRLVTADVTLHTWITDKELDRIEAAGTEFHRVLAAERVNPRLAGESRVLKDDGIVDDLERKLPARLTLFEPVGDL